MANYTPRSGVKGRFVSNGESPASAGRKEPVQKPVPAPRKRQAAEEPKAPAPRRERAAKKVAPTTESPSKFWRLVKIAVVLGVIGAAVPMAYLYRRYQAVVESPNFPKLDELLAMQLEVSTQVYDNTGTHLLGEIFQTRRTPVALKDVSPKFIAALKAAEDANFEQHDGVDWMGIAKAIARKVIRRNAPLAGASTLTQQDVKNRLWIKEGVKPRTLDKKLEEVALAMELERKKSKDEILEDYINTIYLGQLRYGVEAACQNYFGHPAKEMTLAEAALLAALPKGPATYTHWMSPEGKKKALGKWKTRQLYVLNRMVKLGKVTTEEARTAVETPIKLAEGNGTEAGIGDEFVDVVRKELERRYGDKFFRTPLKVITTADWQMQQAAKRAVETGTAALDGLNGANPRPQSAQMTIDENGNVLAMVGGYGYRKGRDLNRAMQAERQTGSLFKTVLWLAAFESGKYNLDSTFVDQEATIPAPQAGAGDWTPRNSHTSETDGQPVTLAYALAKSLNTVAGQLVYELRTETNPLAGVDATIDVVRRLGVTAKLGRNYAMVLGTSSVRISDMTRAYNAISNGGKRPELRFILSVQEGNQTVTPEPFKAPEQAVKPSAAYLTNQALLRVTTEGTGVRAGRELKRPIAGKTGTTQESKDGWFCGSVSSSGHVFTTCTWVGNDDNSSLGKIQVGADRGKDFEGSNTALRHIWIPFVKAAFDGAPIEEFKVPVEEAVVAKPVEEAAETAEEQPAEETPEVPETEDEKGEDNQIFAPF